MNPTRSVRVGAAAAFHVVGAAPFKGCVAGRLSIVGRQTEDWTTTHEAERPTIPSRSSRRRRGTAPFYYTCFSDVRASFGARREAILLCDTGPEGWTALTRRTARRPAIFAHVLALVTAGAAVLPISRGVRAVGTPGTRVVASSTDASSSTYTSASGCTAANCAAAGRTAGAASLAGSPCAAGAANALLAARSCHCILAGGAVAGSSCSAATATARPVDLASTAPARESLVAGAVWIASAGLCTRRTAFAAAAAGAARGKRRHQGQEHELVSEHHFSSAPQASHGRGRRTSAPRFGSRTGVGAP